MSNANELQWIPVLVATRCDECGELHINVRFVDDELRCGNFCAECVPLESEAA